MDTSSTVTRFSLSVQPSLTLRSDLAAAIRQSESLRKTHKPWPPADTGDDPSAKGLVGIMDDELGFVD